MAINTAIGGQARLGNNIVDALNGANAPSYTNVFATMLDGGFANVISPDALNTDTDNWTPPDLATATVIRASSSANIALTGLAAQSGRTLLLHNVGTSDLQLVAESASSTAANRFALSRNLRLFPNSHALLWYDGTSARWRVAGHSGSFAGEVIQQSYTEFSSTFVTNSSIPVAAFTSETFTKRSSASTLMISWYCPAVQGYGGGGYIYLQRDDGTKVAVGAAAGLRAQAANYLFATAAHAEYGILANTQQLVDATAPKTCSYKIMVCSDGNLIYCNRTRYDPNTSISARFASGILIEEICQ